MRAGARPLPGLDHFGRGARRATRRLDRRRGRARRFGVALGIVLPIAATSGAATAVVLREAVIRPPDPAHVPDEQTPLAGTAVVSTVRAEDPGEALPWTVRVARSKTGFTCTTVGQVRDGVFGITGLDGVFRRLPGELSDACGQGGTLTGARVAAADRAEDVRTIVYGAAGEGLRAATLKTARGERPLTVGPGGTFVAVLRGYPEDSAVGVTLRFADGHNERHNFGASPDTLLDPTAARRGRSSASPSTGASAARSCAPRGSAPNRARSPPAPAWRCAPRTAPGSPTPAASGAAIAAPPGPAPGRGAGIPRAPSSGASPATAGRCARSRCVAPALPGG